jgi:hypothetical protein
VASPPPVAVGNACRGGWLSVAAWSWAYVDPSPGWGSAGVPGSCLDGGDALADGVGLRRFRLSGVAVARSGAVGLMAGGGRHGDSAGEEPRDCPGCG